jgi:hypothetical protein
MIMKYSTYHTPSPLSGLSGRCDTLTCQAAVAADRVETSKRREGVLTLTGLSTLSGRCGTPTCQAAAAADRVETSKSQAGALTLTGLPTLSGRCDTLTCQAAVAADRVKTSKRVKISKILFFLLFLTLPLSAQIQHLEYFIDNDPGVGKATKVTGFAQNNNVTVPVGSISSATLSEGLHRIFVRAYGNVGTAENASNHWSLTQFRTFYHTRLRAVPEIRQIEYFIDTDPGWGKGVKVPVSGADVTQSINVALDESQTGLHTLYIRSQNTEGRWSLVQSRTFQQFYVENLPMLHDLEWFVDTDPGFGHGNKLSLTGVTSANLFTVDITGMASGMHTLYVRGRNALMQWGLTNSITFVKAEVTAQADITQLEYFIDNDPGVGKAAPVTVGAPSKSVTANFPVNPAAFDEGIHTLYVRARDEFGRWSITQNIYFYKTASQDISQVEYLEYFIDSDPGFGKGIPVGITPSDHVVKPFTVNLSAIDPGMHRLYIRARNTGDRWSITQSGAFVKVVVPANEPVTALEWFIDADPGIGQGHAVAVSASETEKVFNADFGSLPEGLHTLYVRSRNAAGRWSITQHTNVFRIAPADVSDIVRMEYFIGAPGDPAPYFGEATDIPIVQGQRVSTTFRVNLPSDLAGGWYTFNVRAMDSKGRWSVTQSGGFVKVAVPANEPVTALEWFIDADPGIGQAHAVAVSASETEKIFTADFGNLPAGLHALYVRSRSAAGRWSITQHIHLFRMTSPDVPDVVRMEYFIGKPGDPAPYFGKATAIPFTPGQRVSTTFRVNLPNGLAEGWYTFNVRAMDSKGQWSITQQQGFILSDRAKNAHAVALEYFVDNDPGFGKGKRVTLQSANSEALIPIADNEYTEGLHTLYIRAVNARGEWSVTQSIPLMAASIPDIADIAALEWFIDSDPGVRSANRVAIPQPGPSAQRTFTVPVSTLDAGVHTFYVRAVNTAGAWSITHRQTFLLTRMPDGYQPSDLSKLEWFIDADPGFGKGKPVPVTKTSADSPVAVTFANDMAPGFHYLYIRAQNVKGRWSVTQSIPLMVAEIPADYEISDVVAVEWFIDSDPGVRAAVRIPTDHGPLAQKTFTVPVASLASGMHTFYVRAVNEAGAWSITHRQTFIKTDIPDNYEPSVMARLEYFIDEDPGFGEAAQVDLLPQTNTATAFNINLDSVEDGPHTLYVRAVNKDGRWTHTQSFAFYRTDEKVNWKKETVYLEYFIDADPGFGEGVSIPITASEEVDKAVFIPLTDIWPGIHEIYFRAKDVRGFWSHTQSISLMVIDNPNLGGFPDVTAVEYFIDQDPGFGKGSVMAISANTTINERFYIGIDTIPAGLHELYVRARNSRGEWGHTHSVSIYNTGIPQFPEIANIVAFEYFVDRDPGAGKANRVMSLSQDQRVQQQISVNVDTLKAGIHSVFVRAQDSKGQWSHTQRFNFVRAVLPENAPVSALEWFIDTDPGIGKGSVIHLAAGTNIDHKFNITLPGDISAGAHSLYIRAMNSSEDWSITHSIDFAVIRMLPPAGIAALEYFIDEDPGFGAAIAMPVPYGSLDAQVPAIVPLTGVAPGLHIFYVRAMNTDGVWSLTQYQSFVVTRIRGNVKIMEVEYFVDADPGFGKGRKLSGVVPGTDVDRSFTVDLTGYAPGLHTLYIRALDENSAWGVTQDITFFSFEEPAVTDIVKAEYFIDNPATFGAGIDIPVNPHEAGIQKTVPVNVSSLADGLHTVYVRVKDSRGRWSVTQNRSFVKQTQHVDAETVALEWFIDADPGFGKAHRVAVTAATSAAANIPVNLNAVTPGIHTLYLRAENRYGQWGVTQEIAFLKLDKLETANVTAIEYFIDTDPGFGESPYSIKYSAPQAQASWTTQVNTSALASGIHTLYVRACNEDGRWSVTQYNSFVKVEKTTPRDVNLLEWFIDVDPGFGKATPTAPGANISVDASSLSAGLHTFHVRGRNTAGQWGITQEIAFLTLDRMETTNITAIEYFIDTDPGFGKSPHNIRYSVPQAQASWTPQVNTSSLASGIHTLYVRACNEDGRWSITQYNTFLKFDKLETANITAIEYFIDTDPGFGKSPHNIKYSVPQAQASWTTAVNTTALAPGIHTLYVRACNEDGSWSIMQYNSFVKVEKTTPQDGAVLGLEWFIDVDPGFGSATPTPPDANIAVNTSSLSAGPHTMYIRGRNAVGQWGVTQAITFIKVNEYVRPGITGFEWFIDTDPGFGKANHVSLTGHDALREFIFDIGTITDDIWHTLYMRARDENGQWSVTQDILFKRFEDVSEVSEIAALEWFIDDDPGAGQTPATQRLNFSPFQRQLIQVITVSTSGLSRGIHTFSVRAKNREGEWSLTQYETFALVASHDLTALEWFVDNDYGFGQNNVVPVTPGVSVNTLLTIPTENLSDGAHTLYVRAKDDGGNWGISQYYEFIKVSLDETIVPAIARIEYFFDADPGFGKGKVMEMGAQSTRVTHSFTAQTAADMFPGIHTLYVRAQDTLGRWSHTQYSQFIRVAKPLAHQTVALEWFVDDDPGFGKATGMPVPAGMSTGGNINPGNTAPGAHTLYLRAMDASGQWSHTQPIEFMTVLFEEAADVTAVEYFFDTDPGFGKGIPVPGITAGASVAKTFHVAIPSSMEQGFHTFYMRARNKDGRWSITQYSQFIRVDQLVVSDVAAVEYFFDTDPGFGKGVSVPGITAGASVAKTFHVAIPTGMPQGFHTFYMRARNGEGRWSITQYSQFIKVDKPAVFNTVALEWFIDTDPGFGEANGLPVPAGTSAVGYINPGNTAPGVHTLYVRALDASGQWSHTHSIDFLTIAPEKTANVTAVEYFFDTDPGFGKGVLAPGITAGASVAKTFHVALPTGMEQGFHTFYMRARNEEGRWGITQYNQFIKVDKYAASNTVALEWFIDGDPGFGKGVRKDITPGLSATQNLIIDIDTVSEGVHALYVRAQDVQKRWGVTHSIEFIKIKTEQPANVVAAEWFVDDDPGFGEASAIPAFAPAGNVTRTFAVTLSGIDDGTHMLYVRALDDRGAWSITQYQSFVKTSVRIRPEMVAVEWFIDVDPGFGEAKRLAVNPSATEFTLPFMLVSTQLTAGAHTLYIRSLDNRGNWSITQDIALLVIDIQANEIAKVVALEYFIDKDPGFRRATPVNISPAAELTSRKFFVATAGLDDGAHALYVRAINENESWSITQYHTFVKMTVEKRNPDIVRIEYFIDKDPGFGKGKPITVSPDVSISKVFDVDLTDVVTDEDKKNPNYNSQHTLYIRALAEDGEWAVTHVFELRISYKNPEGTGNWPQGGAVFPAYTEVCMGSVSAIDLRVEGFSERVDAWVSRIIYEDGSALSWTTVPSSGKRELLQVSPNVAGSWQYRAVIFDGDRGPEYSMPAVVKVIAAAVGGKVTANAPEYLCSGKDFKLTLEEYRGDVVRWQMRNTSVETNWTDINETTVEITVMPDDGGVWEYRAEVAMGACSNAFSAPLKVNVISSTTGGMVEPATLTACKDKTFELTARDYLGKVIEWEYSDDKGDTWNTVLPATAAENLTVTPAATGEVYYRVVVKAGNCDPTYSQPAIVTVLDKIETAQAIAGPDFVCLPSDNIRYSIPAVPGVDYYEWVIPGGASFAGESNRNEVYVDFSASTVSGSIRVRGVSNLCGAGGASILPLEVHARPVIANIIGTAAVCVGQTVTYKVAEIPGATYTWVIPVGWTKISVDDTNTITVAPNGIGGTIVVTATDKANCISAEKTLDVIIVSSMDTGPIYRVPNR